MKISTLMFSLMTMLCVTTMVYAADVPVKKFGDILVSQDGLTLYTFDKDVAGSGKSACVDACVGVWPILTAAADAAAQGDYSVIVRDDGTKQWAYKGKPLYFFAKDKQPGDRSGDNVKDIWHVVRN